MRFARQHPFYGWLFVEPADYRRIYNQLIQMRDADLRKGDNSSGFPSGFAEWCEDDLKELSLGEKLSISEKDAIRRQFYRCWIVPAGAKNLKDLFVSIKIKLDKEGNVIYSKLINDNKLNESFFRAAAESALRAVNHPECKKLKVPEKKYATWKEIILDFDPSQSIN